MIDIRLHSCKEKQNLNNGEKLCLVHDWRLIKSSIWMKNQWLNLWSVPLHQSYKIKSIISELQSRHVSLSSIYKWARQDICVHVSVCMYIYIYTLGMISSLRIPDFTWKLRRIESTSIAYSADEQHSNDLLLKRH